jgi:predicted metal-dependent hydrolase
MEYPEPYLAFVAHFNRGEYRACVEPLEELWFAQRDDFHKGLIRLVVGLNQIRLGLDSGPRFLLATARELLQPYHPRHQGLDLPALDEWIATQQARLDQPTASAAAHAFQIVLDPAQDASQAERKEGPCFE